MGGAVLVYREGSCSNHTWSTPRFHSIITLCGPMA